MKSSTKKVTSGQALILLLVCLVSASKPFPLCYHLRVVVLTWKPEVALEREVEGDLFLQDIGQGFGFRPGSFDGAIRCVQERAKSSSRSAYSPYLLIHCPLRVRACTQYLRATMATKRRDLTPNIIPTPPPHALFHNATLSSTQPLARRPTILPYIG